MENIELHLRKNHPPEVFKSIRIIGRFPEKFIGDFCYIRLFYKEYDYKNGDILDSQILRSLQSVFHEAHLQLNVLTLFDKQFEDCLKITKGGFTKSIVTYFYPIVNYENDIPENLKAYYLGLNLNLWISADDPRKEIIPDTLLVNLPFDDLLPLIRTIKQV
jgi:hypothetical protein